jgi:CubicO group peptidase (beta-lactamase class C family)
MKAIHPLLFFLFFAIPIASAQQALSVFPGDSWQQASPESQRVNSAQLQSALLFLQKNAGKDGVSEVAIIRNGYLIHEGANIDKQHGVWSLTKSFTSTVLGLLIDEGKCSLDTLAASILPEMKEHYAGVTLRHFTTMTSGYRAVGDTTTGSYTHGPSSTPFKPSPEALFSPPGSRYAYWDSAMNQFGHILTKIAGESLYDYFKRKVADPIGMHPDKWNWGEFKTESGPAINGGSGNGNKHIFISSRELARFGLLFLNKGRWNNKPLLSQTWVEQASAVQVANSVPLANPKLSSANGPGVYGFNWWVNGMNSAGKRKWPEAPAGTYAASGYNNNDMFIIPEWNMVIVRLGLDQNDQLITDEGFSAFIQKIGEALMP